MLCFHASPWCCSHSSWESEGQGDDRVWRAQRLKAEGRGVCLCFVAVSLSLSLSRSRSLSSFLFLSLSLCLCLSLSLSLSLLIWTWIRFQGMERFWKPRYISGEGSDITAQKRPEPQSLKLQLIPHNPEQISDYKCCVSFRRVKP